MHNHVSTLSGTALHRGALPHAEDWGELARFLRQENLSGHFPFTGGVFPFKRAEEDPARMFAGEGPPERTNRRFHLLAAGQTATRLSTAFDSVTLYGRDPHERPDIWGKVGNSVRRFRDARRSFDLIVLDPPKFAESKAQVERAARGYKDINLLAFKLLRPGGMLFTFSCSGAIARDLFQKVVADAAVDARVDARILGHLQQAPDHPVALAFPEGLYLKGMTCVT